MPSPVLPARPAAGLWRDRAFRSLWLGQTASQLGSQTAAVTVPLIAVVAIGADAVGLGFLRAAQQVPVLLLSLTVGALVDRWRTRAVMMWADLGRAVALAVVPIAYILGVLGFPVLLITAVAVGVLTVFFDIANQASLVRLLPREQLPQGNSALEGSRSAAHIAGPALGGGLVSLLSAPLAIVSSAFFFACSFLAVRRIRRPEPVPEHVGGKARIRDGLRFVARDPALRTVATCSAVFQFSFAAYMTIYLVFLPRTLELSGAAIGLVFAAMGPGALLGSLLAAALPRRFGYGRVMITSAALGDLVLLCVPLMHGSGAATLAALAAINLFSGFFGPLTEVPITAVRQAVTPVRMQGRVAATINFVGMGMAPLGSLTGGFLATGLGPRIGLFAMGAGLLLSPLFMLFSPLARLGRHLPAGRE